MLQYTTNTAQDVNFGFFRKYDRLGPKQKEIWKISIWWCKRHPSAYPKQQHIAEKVGCTREHVNRTFALFRAYGWLRLKSRGKRRTKVLCIEDQYLAIDLLNRQYFKRVEITSKITRNYTSKTRITGCPPDKLKIAPFLENSIFSLQTKLKLSLLPEDVIIEAKDRCIKRDKKGFVPKNKENYFTSICFSIAKERNLKINWKSYYCMLKL